MRIKTISLALLVMGLQYQASAGEPEEAAQFTVRQEAPTIGSNVRRDIVKSENIPLNRQYAQLTAEQKAAVKSDYEKMSDTDEPPFPADGLLPVYKYLSIAHEKNSMQNSGKMTLYVTVDKDGKPQAVSVHESPDQTLTKVAAYALMEQKFKPALCNGTPCSMQFAFHAELLPMNMNKTTQDMRQAFSGPAPKGNVVIPGQ
jgi:hypothetical protein